MRIARFSVGEARTSPLIEKCSRSSNQVYTTSPRAGRPCCPIGAARDVATASLSGNDVGALAQAAGPTWSRWRTRWRSGSTQGLTLGTPSQSANWPRR
eukprot:15461634-Alexandrium_andersonii.AAC.1